MACPPSLKLIAKYLMRAREIEAQDPIVAYYCNYYSLKRAVELRDENDEAASRFLVDLLEKCDRMKSALQRDDGTHQAHVEQFALSVFDYADTEDREGKTSKTTAQTFFAAMCYLDVCSVFGQLSPALSERQRYAQKRAAIILKAIRHGQPPPPPPSDNDGPLSAAKDGNDFSPEKFATPDSPPDPPSTSLYPKPMSDATLAQEPIPPAPEDREYESDKHAYEPAKGSTQEKFLDYPLQAPAYPSSDAVSPLRARDDPPDDVPQSPIDRSSTTHNSHNSNSPPHLKYSHQDSSPVSSFSEKFSKAMILYGPDGSPSSTPYQHAHDSNGSMDPTGASHGMPYGPPNPNHIHHPVYMNHGYPGNSKSFLEAPQPGVHLGPHTGPDYPLAMQNRIDAPQNMPFNAPLHPMHDSGPSHPQPTSGSHVLPLTPSPGFPHGPPPGPGHISTNASPYTSNQGSHHGHPANPPPMTQTNPSHGAHTLNGQGSDPNTMISGGLSGPMASTPVSTAQAYKPSVKEIRDAQRCTRNALSALDFQDVAAAKSNLEQALRLISR